MANKKISELPSATVPLAGTEIFEIVQGGINKQVAASDVGGGGAVDSVNGQTGVVQINADDVPFTPAGNIAATDVQAAIVEVEADSIAQFRLTRTVTGASAIVQGDDNSLIIFNSASPINFTLDQITANSKASLLNIGAGAVTLIAGSGVTITGSVVISGAVGTNYPSAFVFYHTATTPRVSIGGTNGLASASADTSGATITLNFNLERERIFVGSASFGTAKAVTLSNESNGLVMILFLNLTNVAAVLSFDTDFTMMVSDARWNDGAHTFTPQTTGLHKFSAVFNGTDWVMEASNPYYG